MKNRKAVVAKMGQVLWLSKRGTSLCRLKEALHSTSFREPATTNCTPFGAAASESREGLASVWNVGARS